MQTFVSAFSARCSHNTGSRWFNHYDNKYQPYQEVACVQFINSNTRNSHVKIDVISSKIIIHRDKNQYICRYICILSCGMIKYVVCILLLEYFVSLGYNIYAN